MSPVLLCLFELNLGWMDFNLENKFTCIEANNAPKIVNLNYIIL